MRASFDLVVKYCLNGMALLVILAFLPSQAMGTERYAAVVKNLIKEGKSFGVHQNDDTGTVTICEHSQTPNTPCTGTWTCNNGNCSCASGTCTTPPARLAPKGGKGGEANKAASTRAPQGPCTGPCKTKSQLLQQNILEGGGGFGINQPSGGTPGAGSRGPAGPSLR